jgi:hypothetical protein
MNHDSAQYPIRERKRINKLRTIVSCLPSASFNELHDKTKKLGIKSRATLDKGLKDLIDFGLVKKGVCPTCNHMIYEFIPIQTTRFKNENNFVEETVDLGKIEYYADWELFGMFEIVIFAHPKMKSKIKCRKRGKKTEIVTKEFTVIHKTNKGENKNEN